MSRYRRELIGDSHQQDTGNMRQRRDEDMQVGLIADDAEQYLGAPLRRVIPLCGVPRPWRALIHHENASSTEDVHVHPLTKCRSAHNGSIWREVWGHSP